MKKPALLKTIIKRAAKKMDIDQTEQFVSVSTFFCRDEWQVWLELCNGQNFGHEPIALVSKGDFIVQIEHSSLQTALERLAYLLDQEDTELKVIE